MDGNRWPALITTTAPGPPPAVADIACGMRDCIAVVMNDLEMLRISPDAEAAVRRIRRQMAVLERLTVELLEPGD